MSRKLYACSSLVRHGNTSPWDVKLEYVLAVSEMEARGIWTDRLFHNGYLFQQVKCIEAPRDYLREAYTGERQ